MLIKNKDRSLCSLIKVLIRFSIVIMVLLAFPGNILQSVFADTTTVVAVSTPRVVGPPPKDTQLTATIPATAKEEVRIQITDFSDFIYLLVVPGDSFKGDFNIVNNSPYDYKFVGMTLFYDFDPKPEYADLMTAEEFWLRWGQIVSVTFDRDGASGPDTLTDYFNVTNAAWVKECFENNNPVITSAATSTYDMLIEFSGHYMTNAFRGGHSVMSMEIILERIENDPPTYYDVTVEYYNDAVTNPEQGHVVIPVREGSDLMTAIDDYFKDNLSETDWINYMRNSATHQAGSVYDVTPNITTVTEDVTVRVLYLPIPPTPNYYDVTVEYYNDAVTNPEQGHVVISVEEGSDLMTAIDDYFKTSLSETDWINYMRNSATHQAGSVYDVTPNITTVTEDVTVRVLYLPIPPTPNYYDVTVEYYNDAVTNPEQGHVVISVEEGSDLMTAIDDYFKTSLSETDWINYMRNSATHQVGSVYDVTPNITTVTEDVTVRVLYLPNPSAPNYYDVTVEYYNDAVTNPEQGHVVISVEEGSDLMTAIDDYFKTSLSEADWINYMRNSVTHQAGSVYDVTPNITTVTEEVTVRVLYLPIPATPNYYDVTVEYYNDAVTNPELGHVVISVEEGSDLMTAIDDYFKTSLSEADWINYKRNSVTHQVGSVYDVTPNITIVTEEVTVRVLYLPNPIVRNYFNVTVEYYNDAVTNPTLASVVISVEEGSDLMTAIDDYFKTNLSETDWINYKRNSVIYKAGAIYDITPNVTTVTGPVTVRVLYLPEKNPLDFEFYDVTVEYYNDNVTTPKLWSVVIKVQENSNLRDAIAEYFKTTYGVTNWIDYKLDSVNYKPGSIYDIKPDIQIVTESITVRVLYLPKAQSDDSDTPNTGDVGIIPIIALMIGCSAVFLAFSKKRKPDFYE